MNKVLQFGEKQIDYNPDFKLYLTTRNSYIDVKPFASGFLSLINFTVTKSGLEGKLLSIIINHEQPDLELKKNTLLENEEKLKLQLADLERNLLESLAASTGNILENLKLIENLNETKSNSSKIKESLEQSQELQ